MPAPASEENGSTLEVPWVAVGQDIKGKTRKIAFFKIVKAGIPARGFHLIGMEISNSEAIEPNARITKVGAILGTECVVKMNVENAGVTRTVAVILKQ